VLKSAHGGGLYIPTEFSLSLCRFGYRSQGFGTEESAPIPRVREAGTRWGAAQVPCLSRFGCCRRTDRTALQRTAS